MAFKARKKWTEWLSTAEWWYNSSYHSAIKTSPFEALYGYPPPQIHEIVIPDNVSLETQETLMTQEQMIKSLQQNLAYAQHKMKKFADRKRTPRTFEIGDMVYLKMQPYREKALGLGHALKLTSNAQCLPCKSAEETFGPAGSA
jgi:hypothetical protein